MARFAVFLRGMNLGKRRITNEALVATFEELGFARVQAFLASGNVVLESSGREEAIAKRIEKGLRASLDYEVPTFLRSADDMLALAAAKPFSDRTAKARGKLQIVLLKDVPTSKAAAAALKHDSADDWLAIEGRTLFWWPKGGLSQSELDLKSVERQLGTITIRTHGTIQKMASKFFE